MNTAAEPVLFFGVGAGRCGTMALANALSREQGVICAHEGKLRDRESAGAQLLPFLTLQNRLAYEAPARAASLFEAARASMPRVAAQLGAHHFGDIAYNYAPFFDAIGATFPAAKLLVIVRNGVDFVRSATQRLGTDETPVGWAPLGKALSAVEQYVAVGRLAPRAGSALGQSWEEMDHVARNAWLWAETHRLIVTGIARRAPGSTLVLRFEEFFRNPAAAYPGVRRFLGIPGETDAALESFAQPINRRREKVLGPISEWSEPERASFHELAGPMMHELGYPLD